MSTHACNELCDLHDGYGHIAQKSLDDPYCWSLDKQKFVDALKERVADDTKLLEELAD